MTLKFVFKDLKLGLESKTLLLKHYYRPSIFFAMHCPYTIGDKKITYPALTPGELF